MNLHDKVALAVTLARSHAVTDAHAPPRAPARPLAWFRR